MLNQSRAFRLLFLVGILEIFSKQRSFEAPLGFLNVSLNAGADIFKRFD